MRRCEDEKMFYRPPLLEEPCAQTLSGKIQNKIAHPEGPEGRRKMQRVGSCEFLFCFFYLKEYD
jgi:hypothetical protein